MSEPVAPSSTTVEQIEMTNPVRVPSLPGAKNPSVVLDDRGTIHVAFGAENVLYLASTNPAGTAFSPAVKIAQGNRLALGMRRGPRLALAGKTLVVSAVYGGELLAWRSTDGGKTWHGPMTVSDSPGAAREGLHAMASALVGTLACAWLDLREKGTTVFASLSNDAGKTWGRNMLVYRSPSGTVCECCHVSAAFTPSGELLVMLRNVLDGNRDMYLCLSPDRGKSFAPAQKIGVGSWPLNACPMDGGAIASDAKGRIFSAWRREETVYLCSPGQVERRIEEGQQPWVAAGKSGTWCAYLVGRPGRLRLRDPGGVISTVAEGANDPVLSANNRGAVALAWAGPSGLYAARLE